MKLYQVGEQGLMDFINKKTKIKNKKIIRGVGDDSSVISYNKKEYMLLTTDTLVEGVHFKKKWLTPKQIGKKTVEQNVSDIAAMGGYPVYCLVSLQLPSDLDLLFFNSLYNGIVKQCKKYKINIMGGNISSAREISVTITMVGFVEKNRLCLRNQAKIGELLCVTGDLGKNAVGLELLKQGKKGKSINYFLEPKAKLKEGRVLSKFGIKTIEDISDGLASEIHNICTESKKGALIHKEKIPMEKETMKDAKKVKTDPYEFALYGGEEFELVFTASERTVSKLKNKKIKFSVIGEIVDKRKGIWLIKGKKKRRLGRGFEHFKP